jgi:hypothetical protein
MLDHDTQMKLEQLVDTYSVSILLEALSTICWEKSSHVLESYNDGDLSKMWERVGKVCLNASAKAEREGF